MSNTNQLLVASWKVHGLGDRDRMKAVQKWKSTTGRLVKVLAIQEIKAREENLNFNLTGLMEGARWITDYTESDRGGAALILDRTITVLDSGVRGDCTAAWAKVKIEDREFGIIRWKGAVQGWDLLDVYHMASRRHGPHFTRQRVVRTPTGNRLDQAWLDRVYINKGGNWMAAVNKILHDGREGISDQIFYQAISVALCQPELFSLSLSSRSSLLPLSLAALFHDDRSQS
ncbi:hypothetical protein R1sor_020737 [Riccia sorocarpa]|uniref:Uncharacterized protein n=1 Tax=Riccia sorocarpa TaxID=122646 RepID=A0ABD3GGH7_9MARC